MTIASVDVLSIFSIHIYINLINNEFGLKIIDLTIQSVLLIYSHHQNTSFKISGIVQRPNDT